MEVTVICTVLNEEATIKKLLTALLQQTIQPQQVIIVDGGSNDQTRNIITATAKKFTYPFELIVLPGNRSLGRNTAINAAGTELIAITDAGCVPQKNWLEELLAAHTKTKSPVIAGYYQGAATTPFQAAVIPYVLTMPDQINPATFLPATRSMLIEKSAWQQVGGFNEQLADNEDYAFAKELKAAQISISFTEKAVVEWMPRSNLPSFFKMIFRFARGDIAAGIIRPKVLLVFARYVLGIILVILLWEKLLLIGLLVLAYLFWSVTKNYKYVPQGWYWLPVLQLTADGAVLCGSLAGFSQRSSLKPKSR